MKRIKTFNEHVNESHLNEGLISWIKSKISNLSGWAKKFYQKLDAGMYRRIPKGPNKGKPVVMFFAAENGSFDKQYEDYASGKIEKILKSNLEEAVVPLEYTGEDQSVRDISAEELIEEIEFLWHSGTSEGRGKPIFIFGSPGIGKTQIVNQAADQLKKVGVNSVIHLDLQFMSPEDFKGVPSVLRMEEPGWVGKDGEKKFSVGKGITISNVPFEFPQKGDGRRGIIFMDEMNRASEPVLDAVMNFVQDGRIGSYKMEKKDWIIIAAGNRPEDSTRVKDLDFALADRFSVFNYVPELGIDSDTYEIKKGWAKWASGKDKIIPELIYFLADRRDLFHKLDTDKKVVNFPTPRSWTDGALILYDKMKYKGIKSWRDMDMRTIKNIFFDQVGPEAAGAFAEYLELVKNLSKDDMKNIIENPENGKIPVEFKKDKRLIYGLSQNLLNMSDGDPKKLYNICLYISRYQQYEILSWILKRIYDRYPDFKRFESNFSEEPGWEWKNKAAKLAAQIKNELGK